MRILFTNIGSFSQQFYLTENDSNYKLARRKEIGFHCTNVSCTKHFPTESL